MTSRPILVFGAAGQVGTALLELARGRRVSVVGLARADCNITDSAAIRAACDRFDPRLVVNCAAFTAVDRAEREPDAARRVNIDGAGMVSQSAAARDIPVIHLSTDFVFEGRKKTPYCEDDPVNPINVYGQTKAEGEAAVRSTNARHIVLRLAWIFSGIGGNFLVRILRQADAGEALWIADDQFGSPTAATDIGEAVLAIDAALQRDTVSWGTYHFAGMPGASRFEFAGEVLRRRAHWRSTPPDLIPIKARSLGLPAARPASSVLDSSLFANVFGCRARPWHDRVAETVDALLCDEGLSKGARK